MSWDVKFSIENNSEMDEYGGKYIVHKVSKMDTLAGIAIKYGVEVSDIRKLNNLATDLQIFGLKTLLIPLPGRHPPSSLSNGSPSMPNGSACPGEAGTSSRVHIGGWADVLKPMQSSSTEATKKRVSPAMSTLQSFYGLKSPNNRGTSEGTSTSAYSTRNSDYLKDRVLSISPLIAELLSKCHLESYESIDESTAECSCPGQCVPLVDRGDEEGDMSNQISVCRRQKAEADTRAGSIERYLKEGSGGVNSKVSPLTGKTLAMRKVASRAELSANSGKGNLNSTSVDSLLTDSSTGVRKSSSASSLLDQDSSNSTSIWPSSRWNVKPDLQALSTTAIARPIFYGLPKPITSRGKAALD